MKKSFILLAFVILFPLFISSCDTEEDSQPRNLLDQVGFEGTLPDGSEFGKSDIRSANGVSYLGVNQVYTGRHDLSVRSFETGWSLSLETPEVIFSKNPPVGESNGGELMSFFDENYSYEMLLEKLLAEKQKAAADPTYRGVESLRIVLTNQDEYYAYLQNPSNSQETGKIRILEVTAGIQKNLQGQDVRKIEVLVEIELNLKATNAEVRPQEGKLKGIARFKYREDFYQGEFEN